MKYVQIIFILLCIVPVTSALEGSMPLLAVQEAGGIQKGGIAELFLEVKEGSGRVFVDTFPLSKLDTQISMRFAKEIACDFLEMDCSGYDFIYLIKAESPIIGGPSAGAAATVLTVAVLTETPINRSVAISGTINSGGLIGPVGSLKEKIDAAAENGISLVLIPEGEMKTNESSLASYGIARKVKVEEVGEISTAIEAFTGRKFSNGAENITISESYEMTMNSLASQLCDRNDELKSESKYYNITTEAYDAANNLSIKGKDTFGKRQYYSAASYCFGSNIKFNEAFLRTKNFSEQKYKSLFSELKTEIRNFEKKVNSLQIKTITDLESYMVVRERLIDAMDATNITNSTNMPYAYSYANERLLSAHSWAKFLQHTGKELQLDNKSLEESCRKRISEAEERLEYVKIFVPVDLSSPISGLASAYADLGNGEYAMCLFKASKAKAEVNIILNTLGIEEEFLPALVGKKLDAANRVIQKVSKKGMFPILGYSYYEYAENLKDTEIFSSLLYAEYSLELSNIDMYFRERKNIAIDFNAWPALLFALGIMAGSMITYIVMRKTFKKVRKRK
ncbi:hypothetical protein J4401_04400 [Candidatus Woesearchaeota archaeon]|nr:hypothetical protein [Candidatus Woesearchaeota archaeon]